jgi:hypothetical protein
MLHNLLLIPSDKQTAADRWGVLLHNTHQVATLGAEEEEKDEGADEDGDGEGGSSVQHARWRIGPHELHRLLEQQAAIDAKASALSYSDEVGLISVHTVSYSDEVGFVSCTKTRCTMHALY